MANDLSASFPEYWSRRMQLVHHKLDVYRAIANFEEESGLKDGDTVHRPYRSALTVDDYTRGTAFTVQDITDADESMSINKQKVIPIYVDDFDGVQSHYPSANKYADDAAAYLSNNIDGSILAEVANASNTIDDSDFGGTASNGHTLTAATVLKLFTVANKKLSRQNAGMKNRFAVISPEVKQVLLEYLAGKETQKGDEYGQNGNCGMFFGFDLYESNSTYWTGKLLIGTLPTDGDTVVVNGVTFTYETGTIDAAGKVKAVTDAATSITNLVAAINAPGTTSATFQALSAADQKLMKGISATAVSGGLTVAAEGKGYVVVSETLTAAADIWTAALQVQHIMFGIKGAIDVVIQDKVKLQIKDVPDKLGKNLVTSVLFGKKTFAEGAKWLVDAKIRSDAY